MQCFCCQCIVRLTFYPCFGEVSGILWPRFVVDWPVSQLLIFDSPSIFLLWPQQFRNEVFQAYSITIYSDCPLAAIHISRARAPHTHNFRSLSRLRIPLSVVSALRHCSMHIEITWFIFIHLSPKRSWRSTVVAHFRFNKNVFIYIDASDDDNDGYAHGAFWCRAHKITYKKDGNVHHVDGGNCNVLDIHSRCLRQFRSAGHLIQMRELVW